MSIFNSKQESFEHNCNNKQNIINGTLDIIHKFLNGYSIRNQTGIRPDKIQQAKNTERWSVVI